MICESVMAAGKVDFGHVARRAIVISHFAGFRLRLTSGMTGLALGIVIYVLAIYFLMRIVTRSTAYAAIIRIETLAVRESIRLETDVGRPMGAIHGDLLPRAMALSAKIAGLLGV
jgi:hypothetical protein